MWDKCKKKYYIYNKNISTPALGFIFTISEKCCLPKMHDTTWVTQSTVIKKID